MSKTEHEEPVWRAVRAFRDGRDSDERCFFCQGKILVDGSPPGESLFVVFTCPCKKSSGSLKGI